MFIEYYIGDPSTDALWFDVDTTNNNPFYCSVLKGVYNDENGPNKHIPVKCKMHIVDSTTNARIELTHFDTISGDIQLFFNHKNAGVDPSIVPHKIYNLEITIW